MNRFRNEAEPNPEYRAESGRAGQHATSRRTLLGAAGGFALATSGLLLPRSLFDEAEATDEHPVGQVQHRKRQRHSKHRHDRRRRHDNRHDKPTRQGADEPHEIELVPHVNGSSTVPANFSVKKGDAYQLIEGRYLMPNESAHFRTPSSAACLEVWGGTLGYSFFFHVDSPPKDPPTLMMGHHGTADKGWTDGTIVFKHVLSVDEMSPPMKVDGFSFRVTRLDNTAKFRVFDIAIAPPIS